MSSRNGAPIDFQAWAQNQIVKRTEAALKERDAAFAGLSRILKGNSPDTG